MNRLNLIFVCLIGFTPVFPCLRVVSVSVPLARARGAAASLGCEYELEGARLYSVKWYRDNEEFYRYMPGIRPPQHAYRLEGITVDLEKSSARRVQLRELTLRSRGLYRCEVSEEAPSFFSAHAEAYMEVYYFPREGPTISGHERKYIVGQPLDINCTSAKAFPAPELQWHIDGERVNERAWLTSYGARPATQGLLVSTLALHAPVKPKMKLRCIAAIGSHRREKTVFIETSQSSRCKANFWSTVILVLQTSKLIQINLSIVWERNS